MFFVNARAKFNPPIPLGYYGNCIAIACAISKARDLSNKTLDYALELVMKAKSIVSEEYVRSTVDLMAIKDGPYFNIGPTTYMTSSLTRAGFDKINFGWGKPTYGGPATEELIPEVSISRVTTCLLLMTTANQESWYLYVCQAEPWKSL